MQLKSLLSRFIVSIKISQLPLIFIVVIAMVVPSSRWSYTYNENGRLASGLIYLRDGSFYPFHVNPPLSSLVGALPAYFDCAKYPTRGDIGFTPLERNEYKAGSQFIEKNARHRTYLIFGRIFCLLFTVLGAIFCFNFCRSILGKKSGYVGLLLLLFSPYFFGYGSLIMPDVPSATFAIAAIYFFWKWLKQPEMLEAFIAGIILGLAELTKFTLLIFYPLFIVLWLCYKLPEFKTLTKNDWFYQTKQIIVIFAISVLVINMGYLFEGTGKQFGTFKFQTALFTGDKTVDEVPRAGGNRFEGTLLGYLPMPLPSNYIQGIDTQRLDFERGLPSYLRGEWSDHGWWYYYLYALLIKTPLGTIGLFFLAIFCTFFQKGYNASWRDEMVILLSGIVLLAFVSSQSGFSVHSRYTIPALPFFFIWMSKVGKAFTLKRPIVATLATLLITWSVLSSLWVYPHSISYFNELAAILPTPEDKNYPKSAETQKSLWQKTKYVLDAGPKNGPRHLLDSNIDWGQDLFNLERWCKTHPDEVTDMKVAYWGSYPLELTKIPSTGMPLANSPQPGWYALSVNYIYDRSQQYRYFLNFEPVAMAGYSICIYHITLEEVDRVRREMGLPEIGTDNLP